jgi:ATP-dependent Clp protease ATP-binding subunit ClpA
MEQRFTQRARKILKFAEEEAKANKQATIGTEHILIGMLRDTEGIACRALQACEVGDIQRVRELCAILSDIPSAKFDQPLDLHRDTKVLLYAAVDAARSMDNHFIGTEHLLLGLVQHKKFVACQALKELGIFPDQVRQQVYDIVKITPRPPTHFHEITAHPEYEALYPDEVQQLIRAARQHTEQLRHKQLEPEHLMLALLDAENSETLALFGALGMDKAQALDAVQCAALNAPKRKDHAAANPLLYSHLTQTALVNMFKLPTAVDKATPKDMLLGLVKYYWVLVRLWSLYNIDTHTLQTALASIGLGLPPPPRSRLRYVLSGIFLFDIVGLLQRVFKRK